MDLAFVKNCWGLLKKGDDLTKSHPSTEAAVQATMDKIFRILIDERNRLHAPSISTSFKYKSKVVIPDRRKELDGTIFYERDRETWSTLLLGMEYEAPNTTPKEGSGQALSYLNRMMSARLRDDYDVTGFAIFSNYTDINIIRCNICKGEGPEYWETGLKPLFRSDLESHSEGFLLLLSLLFAKEEILGIAGAPLTELGDGPNSRKLQERLSCGPNSDVYQIDGGGK